MTTLFIRPLDTQFHRDGRPFDAGIESEARCIFPPYPRSLYGCLRAAIMSNHPSYSWGAPPNDPSLNALRAVVGDPSGLGSLTLRGPCVARSLPGTTDVARLYQAPLDLVSVKHCRDTYRLVSPQEDQSPLRDRSDLKDGTLYPSRQNGNATEVLESCEGDYLDDEFLRLYLTGNPPEKTWVQKAEHLHRVEPRIGLCRDAERKTAKAGLLYAARHVRMEDEGCWGGGFVVEVEEDGGLLPASGLLRLGGDSRPAEYREVPPQDWSQIKTAVQGLILQTGRFKMVLVTPALFGTGWYPDFLNSSLTRILPGCTQPISLVGACVGRALPIGGFDLVKGYPKPIQQAVPAGSVYFFKFEDWNSWNGGMKQQAIDKLLSHRFNRSLCRDPYDKEGFGVALIGGW